MNNTGSITNEEFSIIKNEQNERRGSILDEIKDSSDLIDKTDAG